MNQQAQTIDVNAARSRLFDLYLSRDNLKVQIESTETEIRDLRNFIAGHATAEAQRPVSSGEVNAEAHETQE